MSNPRVCYFVPADAYVEGKGYRVSFVTEGKPGHAPTGVWPYTGALGETLPYFWGHDHAQAEAAAERQNERMGLSREDVAEIITSSMRASS